jgi:GntR family transcriptional regulator
MTIDDLLVGLDIAPGQAVYRRLAAVLATAIERGELGPGQALPPVRQLAEQLRVNFNTVARAYRLLAERDLVQSRQGQGTRVSGQPEEGDAARALETMTAAFLQRAYQQGYDPQEVRLELAAAIRRWLQEGAPPLP